jgi:hypothetical protein
MPPRGPTWSVMEGFLDVFPEPIVSNPVVTDLGQRLAEHITSLYDRLPFQTLLSWISVNGEAILGLAKDGRTVSNLVVMDLGQRRALSPLLVPMPAGFQTLLSWISVNGASPSGR